MMLAVCEEKIKEDVNGKTKEQVGETHAATPTRLEFLILLHIISLNNWDTLLTNNLILHVLTNKGHF